MTQVEINQSISNEYNIILINQYFEFNQEILHNKLFDSFYEHKIEEPQQIFIKSNRVLDMYKKSDFIEKCILYSVSDFIVINLLYESDAEVWNNEFDECKLFVQQLNENYEIKKPKVFFVVYYDEEK